MDKAKIMKGVKLVGLVLGGAALGAGAASMLIPPQEVVKEVEVIKEVQVEKLVNQTVEIPVETIVEVEKMVEVPVDNGNLDMVLDHIYDNNGRVQYLTEDLDDDEVSEIVERVAFSNEIRDLAIEEIKKEGEDLLDKEEFDGVEFDDRDIERFKIYGDDEEVVIEDIDFEDKDATVIVEARFEQDDVKYKATYEVTIKDGEVDDSDLVDIEYR